jgi:hypothetical protein
VRREIREESRSNLRWIGKHDDSRQYSVDDSQCDVCVGFFQQIIGDLLEIPFRRAGEPESSFHPAFDRFTLRAEEFTSVRPRAFKPCSS